MPLIGYARVSTGEQTLDPQRLELRAAGCAVIHEEHASGADRTRPALARLLATIRPGETLEAKGAHFRSLGDPIDTTTAQGKFSLQVMGRLRNWRSLIRERTKAGLRAARAQGRVGGNPALKAGHREAIRKLRVARDETYFRKLEVSVEAWLLLVRRYRPDVTWGDPARFITVGPDRPGLSSGCSAPRTVMSATACCLRWCWIARRAARLTIACWRLSPGCARPIPN